MKRILAILLALMLLCSGALADENVLVVSGSASVGMEADRASAALGVMMNGDDVAGLQQQVNATINAIYAALKSAGLDEKDISTNYLYISPRYDYSEQGEKIVGYSINSSLSIQADEIDKIGSYIDAAFAAGANTFDSISFSAQDDAEARAKALTLAVQDARAKAEVIAAAAGKTLGEVLEIQEGNQNAYAYNTAGSGAKYAMTESAALDSATTVRASQVVVSAEIQITYELK